ncbi:hypothetical protein CR513_00708, partial [Mucuna pruriens]
MDLDEHLAKYIIQVNLFSSEDVILCRIFPTSLKGLTICWYMQLPANSIDSLCKEPPTTMDDLRMKTTSYIRMEEKAEFFDSVYVGESLTLRNHRKHGHSS